MDDRSFFDALELWSGRWKFGETNGFNALVHTFLQMNEVQIEMAALYLRQLPYDRFLDTRYWYAIQREVKTGAKGRCRLCAAACSTLHAHHRSYLNHGKEHLNMFDLIAVCEVCHKRIHEAEFLLKSRDQK